MNTYRGGHEAIAVEGRVMVGLLGHFRLLVNHIAQGAGGTGLLLAATLSLHCQIREFLFIQNTTKKHHVCEVIL